MKLTELVNAIGDDNIKVQSIDGSLVKSADKKRTKDTELTIATDQITTNDALNQTGKVGLVIWIDRKEFTKLIQQSV